MANNFYENGHCPKCDGQRADVVAEHEDKYEDGLFTAVTEYKILACRGCGEIYFKTLSRNSEDYDYTEDPNTREWVPEPNLTVKFWPPTAKRRPPDWAYKLGFEDPVLGSLFNDVYTALDNNLAVLAAIGMRTVFDRASELLGVDSGRTFGQKLNDLKDRGHITTKEVGVLEALIDAGHAAAHRGWTPDPRQLNAMMIILETFLHRAFLLGDIGAELGKGVPPKPTITKTAKKPASGSE